MPTVPQDVVVGGGAWVVRLATKNSKSKVSVGTAVSKAIRQVGAVAKKCKEGENKMAEIGDKFVIEIAGITHGNNGRILYGIKGFNTLVFDEYGLKRLKPYSREETETLTAGFDFGQKRVARDYERVNADDVIGLLKSGVDVKAFDFEKEFSWDCKNKTISFLTELIENENSIFYRKKETE